MRSDEPMTPAEQEAANRTGARSFYFRDRDSDVINRVRELTNLGPDALTNDLILAMDGTPEERAHRILEYIKAK